MRVSSLVRLFTLMMPLMLLIEYFVYCIGNYNLLLISLRVKLMISYCYCPDD